VTNYERFLAIDGQIFVPGSGNFLPQRVLENRGDTLLRRARRSNDGDAVKRIEYGIRLRTSRAPRGRARPTRG
jgi:hypothetical protein